MNAHVGFGATNNHDDIKWQIILGTMLFSLKCVQIYSIENIFNYKNLGENFMEKNRFFYFMRALQSGPLARNSDLISRHCRKC